MGTYNIFLHAQKNRKAFIYLRTDKSKVAEPDISAGLLFQALYLSTGYVTYKEKKEIIHIIKE